MTGGSGQARAALVACVLFVPVALGAAACDGEKKPPYPDHPFAEQAAATETGALPLAATAPAEPPPPPPPPGPPAAFEDLMDAAMGGPVPLDPAARRQLRAMQVHAGDQLVLLDDGWSERAEAVFALGYDLEAHGIEPPLGLLEELGGLRARLLASPGWTGDEPTDLEHAKRLVHAEHGLTMLWLIEIEALGAMRPHPPQRAAFMRERLLDALALWEAPDQLLATLPPPHDAYDALRGALEDYRTIVDGGGFVLVGSKARRARPRKKHDTLPALRRRLAQEDPEGAGEGEVWDEELTEALRRARDAFQLPKRRKARSLIDKALLEALAMPAEERLASIRRNLGRLRQSAMRDHPYAVYINLPDYHGEVWDADERLMRFKVVIGNTRRERGRMINATPELEARIETVIYNPWWNVPKRIYERELLKSAEKWSEKQAERVADPAVDANAEPVDYWEAKGYEVKNPDDPVRTWVRRRPGPGNALGKVKFIFENRYFVFLHDTPQKKKFRPARRAFSHGCMRVHEPLELAELLLSRDGTWTIAEDKRVMKHYKETPISLRSPVPLVVEYVTARVDDGGRVHFLGDIYRKDPPPAIAGR